MSAPLTFFLASGNPHKVEELRALAASTSLPVLIRSARDVGGMPPVVEDTGTFPGNAAKKARALQPLLPAGAWALADDSGLCVDALEGGPGVESAYFAGPAGDPVANLRKLVAVLREVPAGRRGASFRCVLCAVGPAGQERLFTGECAGQLLAEPRGGAGFGYDPLFVPAGAERSFAELTEAEKNRVSHRARAWAALAEWVRTGAA